MTNQNTEPNVQTISQEDYNLATSIQFTSDEKACFLYKVSCHYSIDHFIETGTHLGTMPFSLSKCFSKIDTVEISKNFSDRIYATIERQEGEVRELFEKINFHTGDSREKLKELLLDNDEQCLFFLDAHYSGGETEFNDSVCPTLEELAAIENHHRNDHLIVIDDLKTFVEDSAYPSPETVCEKLLEINSNYNIVYFVNMIVAFPATTEHKEKECNLDMVIKMKPVSKLEEGEEGSEFKRKTTTELILQRPNRSMRVKQMQQKEEKQPAEFYLTNFKNEETNE
jgi:hypothetical protein